MHACITVNFIIFLTLCVNMKNEGYHSHKDDAGILHNPLTTLIFDMDNTLFDLVYAKTRACGAVTGRMGIGKAEELFSYFLRKQGGFDDPGNIRDYMEDHSCYDADLFMECESLYREEQTRNLVPYQGVEDTLSLLKSSGFQMGIVTDARQPDASLRLGTDRAFTVLRSYCYPRDDRGTQAKHSPVSLRTCPDEGNRRRDAACR